MDYELYVQIEKGGEWQRLDLPDLSVPMNYQINTLAELKDRNGSYSQNISLPRSPHNMRVFGFGLDIEVVSDIPYRRYRCQLLCQGVLLSPPGAVLKVSSLKRTTIDAQILSGAIDLIKVLQEKTMESGEDDGFWRMLDVNSVPDGGSGTLGNGVHLSYPYALLVRNPLSATDVGTPDGFMEDVTKIYPHLNFYETVEWMLKQEGYSLETNVKDRGTYIPCVVPKPAVSQTYIESAISGDMMLCSHPGGQNYTINWNNSSSGFIGMFRFLTVECAPRGAAIYKPPHKGKVHGVLTLHVTGTITVETTITKIGKSNEIIVYEYKTLNEDKSYEFDAILNENEEISAWIKASIGNLLYGYSATIVFQYTPDEIPEEPTPGITYDLLASMGFKSRADFFKAFLQVYGLTLDIDPADKVVRAYSLDEIYGNKDKAYDWSGKLALNKDTEIFYQMDGYAQRNTIKLVENTDNNVKDEYTFGVNDQNLEEEKELFTIDFMALTAYKENNIPYTNYPVYEIEREGNTRTAKYKKPSKTHLTRPEALPLNHTLKQGNVTVSKRLPGSMHWRLSVYINGYYGILTNVILDNTKKLTAYFALTPADIENIDLFIPVWLEQYGHYFYIAKINNFTVGKLTKVELIKI